MYQRAQQTADYDKGRRKPFRPLVPVIIVSSICRALIKPAMFICDLLRIPVCEVFHFAAFHISAAQSSSSVDNVVV